MLTGKISRKKSHIFFFILNIQSSRVTKPAFPCTLLRPPRLAGNGDCTLLKVCRYFISTPSFRKLHNSSSISIVQLFFFSHLNKRKHATLMTNKNVIPFLPCHLHTLILAYDRRSHTHVQHTHAYVQSRLSDTTTRAGNINSNIRVFQDDVRPFSDSGPTRLPERRTTNV